ncbi:DUF1772 domain-containing protein [Paenarthrobacter sp. PH39-S1]|uniref:DUF1772 domain-containing protein n=1 Tax=Paenarthrobacter sp. PH39-S1 TaxID=3046204 RepID=UPI0024BA2893|nr:DUF1772 domain-containing protein [Paenarthrobacter sp. PH39-S1]MDJ0357959.1 DUF1772 domain-containing protein [Paenarthrobacter sp. PH39-S1]
MRSLIRVLQFVTIICVALVFGLTLTHVLQAPGSRALTGAEWLTVQNTFYGGFATVGGTCEVLGAVSAGALAVLSVLSGKRRDALIVGIVCLCLIGTLIVFFVGNLPVNARVAVWSPDTLPADWRDYRNTWETSHAISTLLSGIGFLVLTGSLVWSRKRAAAGSHHAR